MNAHGLRCIDLFAGAGGFSAGASAAGATVVWAANHWQTAIDTHAANHPSVTHACVDLRIVDWTRIPEYDVLLASPACQGHSRARGSDKPHHDALRATAWVVTEALEITSPRGFIVENVPEFAQWQLFPEWQSACRKLGYTLRHAVLDAADVGVPQHRRRLFVIGTRGKCKLKLPLVSPIHHVPVSRVLDLDTLGASVDRLGARTRHQIQCGIAQHGGAPFLTPYYGSSRDRGDTRSIERPSGTLTTVDRYGLWNQGTYRMLSITEMRRIMGFPDGYLLPSRHADAVKCLGNAVCPPAATYMLNQLAQCL